MTWEVSVPSILNKLIKVTLFDMSIAAKLNVGT